MTRIEPFTVGTHNLLDGAARPTAFADLLLFTEFPIKPLARAAAMLRLKARGYIVMSDWRQRDLVIAARRRLFRRRGKSYTHVIDGRPGVTPNRGTLVALLEQRATGVQVAALDEHRINAWYPPFKRGEPKFRAAAWRKHENVTADVIRRLEDSGYRVVAGGDTNTPRDIRAYELTRLREVGERLDRVASRRIGDAVELPRIGSDHWRLRATVRP